MSAVYGENSSEYKQFNQMGSSPFGFEDTSNNRASSSSMLNRLNRRIMTLSVHADKKSAASTKSSDNGSIHVVNYIN